MRPGEPALQWLPLPYRGSGTSGGTVVRESLRIGRIAGVNVGINWSVLAIFALLWFSLSAGRFPAAYPDHTTGMYIAAGGVAATVFFLSLLAHEVAHALVARRNGIEVEGITLWLFGGVARLSGEARDPGADLRIAGVGPLVSLALAAVFFVSSFAPAGLVGGVLLWLAVINAALAIFNLMPAAPLDGGRILRAFLWRRRRDRLSATVTAARAGRVFGFVLIGLGLVEFAFGAGIGGLWFAFIGWFLTSAASAEERFAELRGAVGGLTVGEVMTADPTVAPASLTVEELLNEYVLRHRYSTFPLVEDGRAVGLVTLRQLKQVSRDRRATTPVRHVACDLQDLPTAHPEQPLNELLPGAGGCGAGRVLVLRDGTLAGIISPTDIARVLELSDLRDPRERQHV